MPSGKYETELVSLSPRKSNVFFVRIELTSHSMDSTATSIQASKANPLNVRLRVLITRIFGGLRLGMTAI